MNFRHMSTEKASDFPSQNISCVKSIWLLFFKPTLRGLITWSLLMMLLSTTFSYSLHDLLARIGCRLGCFHDFLLYYWTVRRQNMASFLQVELQKKRKYSLSLLSCLVLNRAFRWSYREGAGKIVPITLVKINQNTKIAVWSLHSNDSNVLYLVYHRE